MCFTVEAMGKVFPLRKSLLISTAFPQLLLHHGQKVKQQKIIHDHTIKIHRQRVALVDQEL